MKINKGEPISIEGKNVIECSTYVKLTQKKMDEEMSKAMGEFANDFMVFCLSLNEVLKSNGIEPIKF